MAIARRILGIATASALLLTLGACSGGGTTGATSSSAACNVGISMPTRSLERWINDGEGLQTKLKGLGCTVDLQYADNKTDQQISQIQNQVAGGAKILVIAAIDGLSLGPALEEAKKQDVTVIAYDRLINGSPNVDYYATFDNYKVGQLQAQYLADTLDLASGAGPFNLEAFAGSADDNNAKVFFAGSWDVLLPYVKSGKLVVPSGKSPTSNEDWVQVASDGYTSAKAQAEMENRLSSFYTKGKRVNAVLSVNDSIALGIAAALKSAQYNAGSDWPLITGQDADKANVKAILAGEQAMTVWKDTRALGDRVVKMIESITAGKKVEVNDTKSYDNGVKVVPAYLLDPQVVTKDDVKSVLIDSGFLKASDVGL